MGRSRNFDRSQKDILYGYTESECPPPRRSLSARSSPALPQAKQHSCSPADFSLPPLPATRSNNNYINNMKNTIRTVSLPCSCSAALMPAHRRSAPSQDGKPKAGATGAVCTADEFTANKNCRDCTLTADGKPTDKTWCENWAQPDSYCAACDFASGKTWCWSVMGSPLRKQRLANNTIRKMARPWLL